jgi:hypothetical protein
MAAPVINSITVTPDPVPVGQTATITVDASDPDAQTVTVSVTVTDSGGNTTTGQSTFPISDPLTYLVTADSGTVTATAQANVFTWTA